MSLLGARLRQRRRQLGLRQRDVTGDDCASFLSKVENGAALPSLNSLRQWAAVLSTTAGDLLGDHLVLEAAKHSILLTDQCLTYLDQLPPSSLTEFLRQLTTSATALSVPVPDPPPDPSLEYLTALVHLHRGEAQAAEAVLLSTLARARSAPWRIFHLSLLCQIYAALSEPAKHRKASDDLRAALAELNHQQLLHTLPEAHLLSTWDLDLLKLSSLLKYARLSLD